MGAGGFIEFLIKGAIIVPVMTGGMMLLAWIGDQLGIAIRQMFGVGGQWHAECRREQKPADDAICAVVDHAEPSA